MNKTIYFFSLLFLISQFVNAQKIVSKIDLELPNNIKAVDLISYDYNDESKQYSLTFLKDLDSKKSTINVLTLNNDFEIIESSEYNLNEEKEKKEDEEYKFFHSKLKVGPYGKPLELEHYFLYPKKGGKKYDYELQHSFYAGKNGIERYKFIALLTFNEVHSLLKRSTETGEYFDPSSLNYFYILGHIKSNLYLMKFNNNLKLLNTLDLQIEQEKYSGHLVCKPSRNKDNRIIEDAFEITYSDDEEGFICRVSNMNSCKKLQFSTITNQLITHPEWDNFMLLNEKKKLIWYNYSNFTKVGEHNFNGPSKVMSSSPSLVTFCTINNGSFKIFENNTNEMIFKEKYKHKVSFNFNLDGMQYVNINNNSLGIMLKEEKDAPPMKCEFLIIDSLGNSYDSFTFTLEDNHWSPDYIESPDKESYVLLGHYYSKVNGLQKGIKIIKRNLNATFSNHTISNKNIRKDISYTRPPSDEGKSEVGLLYISTIDNYFFDEGGDFWVETIGGVIIGSYSSKIIFLLKANNSEIQNILIKVNETPILPKGYFYRNETDRNRTLYTQLTSKMPVTNSHLQNPKYFFRLFDFNTESNKFEFDGNIGGDDFFLIPNNSTIIFNIDGYFNGDIKPNTQYKFHTWDNNLDVFKFIPTNNKNQVKIIGKLKGKNILQLRTIDLSALSDFNFHPLYIEYDMILKRLEYVTENNSGIIHRIKLLKELEDILEKLIILGLDYKQK